MMSSTIVKHLMFWLMIKLYSFILFNIFVVLVDVNKKKETEADFIAIS